MGRILTLTCIAGFLLPCVAVADSFGGAHGKNRLGDDIHIGGEYDDLTIEVYGKNHDKSKPAKEAYRFSDECKVIRSKRKDFIGLGAAIVCKKEGRSPLAGVTYKVTSVKQECGGWLYTCVKGCNRRVPATMYEQPWEC